jgi:hypothetical protein
MEKASKASVVMAEAILRANVQDTSKKPLKCPDYIHILHLQPDVNETDLT